MEHLQKEQLTKIPNRTDHTCFGCGPGNQHGLQMEFYTDGNMVYSWVNIKQHFHGWVNLTHGGILCTLFDEIMSWTTIYLMKKFILTKNISVDFLKPVYVQNSIRVEGEIIEHKNEREAIVEGRMYNADNQLCAKSRGTFALVTLEKLKSLGNFPQEEIQVLEDMMAMTGV